MIKQMHVTLKPRPGVSSELITELLGIGARFYQAVNCSEVLPVDEKVRRYNDLQAHITIINRLVQPIEGTTELTMRLRIENAVGVIHDALGL